MSVVKSNNGPIIDPALCRCCRAIKKCRILTAEYTWMGKKEVYADMVMDCYGILLSHVDEVERDSGVCATCVVRLREAVAFRQQVLQCEEMFLRAKLEPPQEDEPDENKLKKFDLELKTEPKDYNSDHNSIGDDRDDACAAYSDDDADDNKPLKKEESKPELALKEDATKSEGSDFNGDSSSDSDEPIKKKMKRKNKAKANGAKKKPKIAKKQKAESDETENDAATVSTASTYEECVDLGLHTELIKTEIDGDPMMEVESEETVKKRKFSYVQKETSEYQLLCEQLENNEDLYFEHYNMSKDSFEELFNLLESSIEKEFTSNYRMPIPSRDRLAVCLRYMKSGDSFKVIALSHGLGRSSVSKIVKEVSKAIWEVLQPIYLPVPTPDTWIQSAIGFLEKFHIPNCVGSIGAKHILNKSHRTKDLNDRAVNVSSVVFLAVADANCKLTMIDIDNYGTEQSNDVFEFTSFFRDYIDGEMILPPKPLPGNAKPISYVLVGDESFASRHSVLRPFPRGLIDKDPLMRVYNERLYNARTIDKVFSMLLNEWAIFQRPLECSQESVIYLAKAACCLHNFVRSKHGMPEKVNSLVQTRFKKNKKLLKAFYPCRPLRQRGTNAAISTRKAFMSFFTRDIESTTGCTEEVSTLDVPTQEVPTLETPTQEVSTLAAPTQKVPTLQAPTQEVSTLAAPTQKVPTLQAPTQKVPTLQAPTQEVPTIEAPTQDVPTIEVPKQDIKIPRLEIEIKCEPVTDDI